MDEAIQFLVQHGAVVLFAVVFAEQAGLPVPALPLLVAAGALVGAGHLNLWVALGVTISAALLANWLWYELGRRRGHRVLNLLCRIALEPSSCVRRTEDFLAKHGIHSLVVAKFIPGLSTIAPALAGIMRQRASLFLLYDGLGVVLWAGSSMAVGYLFSSQIEGALVYAEGVAPILGAVLVVSIVYIISKAWLRRRHFRRVTRITVKELQEKLGAREAVVLVDLRSSQAVQTQPGIPGAVFMPFDDLKTHYHELPHDRDIIPYCDCPNDAASVQATLLLREKGFTRVWPLAGGIESWERRSAVQARKDQVLPEQETAVA
jgi:membrane protein DedA with SNARE-associated domain/rhodanese-related sulfurtransferase